MTVLSATQQLWLWFSKKTSFSFDNIKELLLVIEDFSVAEAAVRAALIDLEKLNLIAFSPIKTTNGILELWILRKPFDSYEQSVTISANVAIAISDVVNNLIQGSPCNPGSINETDIQNLLLICHDLLKSKNENEND